MGRGTPSRTLELTHADLPGRISESLHQAKKEIMSAFRARSLPDAADRIGSLRRDMEDLRRRAGLTGS